MKDTLVELASEEMAKQRISRKWSPSVSRGVGGTGSSDNVLYGVVLTDGSKKEAIYPCHKFITYWQQAEVLWSCYGFRTDETTAKRYFRFLVNSCNYSELTLKVDSKGMDETGFILTDLDKTPANLVHNFLITTRVPSEWPKFVEAWYELVTCHSINDRLAFLFSTCFRPLNQDTSETTCCFTKGAESVAVTVDKYDWPLDMARADETYVRNFLVGRTAGASVTPFYPTAKTSPVNTLWGNLPVKQDETSYVRWLDKTYRADFTVKRTVSANPYKGTFSSTPDDLQTDLVYTPESLLEILKLEQKRLLG